MDTRNLPYGAAEIISGRMKGNPHHGSCLQRRCVGEYLSEMAVIGLFELVLDQNMGAIKAVLADNIGCIRADSNLLSHQFQIEAKLLAQDGEIACIGKPWREVVGLVLPYVA